MWVFCLPGGGLWESVLFTDVSAAPRSPSLSRLNLGL